MTVAPSRIWAHGACMGQLGRPLEASPSFHWGRWATRTGDPGHCTEYVRADLADAQAQEIARLRDALQDALQQLQYLSTEQQRASTNGVMARIRNAIGETQ